MLCISCASVLQYIKLHLTILLHCIALKQKKQENKTKRKKMFLDMQIVFACCYSTFLKPKANKTKRTKRNKQSVKHRKTGL